MKIIVRLLLISLIQIAILSQPRELYVTNSSNVLMAIKIYPVGCIFNGQKHYTFKSSLNIFGYPYVTGYEFFNPPIQPGNRRAFEHDADGGGLDEPPIDLDGIIGYGKYRIDFFEYFGTPPSWQCTSYCYVDYSHSNYPWSPLPSNGLTNDIFVYYEGSGVVTGWFHSELPADRTLKIWDQEARLPGASETQNKSGFKSTDNGELK